MFALTDFFNAVVAEASLGAVAAPIADAAFTIGTAFAFPVPKVPELRIYGLSEFENVSCHSTCSIPSSPTVSEDPPIWHQLS